MRVLVNRFFPPFISGRAALGLLILRVVAGAALMLHGWSKIQQPFSWMGPNGQPAWVQAFAAGGEVLGGLALLLGLLSPLAALWVMATMSGAYFIAHRGDPWINPGGKSFELASVYFLIALTILFTGPGRFSLDHLFFGASRDVPDDRRLR
jgi:putative oxidoreductase